MGKYLKKPIERIEAVQLKRGNDKEMANHIKGSDVTWGVDQETGISHIVIHTSDGLKVANENDFIIKKSNGEFYPCKEDVFKLTYEEQ